MNRIWILSILLVLVSTLALGCGGGEVSPTKAPAPAPTATSVAVATSAPAESSTTDGSSDTSTVEVGVSSGQELSVSKGCIACHSIDGSVIIGPSWKGIYGTQEALEDGTSVEVNDAYIKESILNPAAKLAKGFQPLMPVLPLTDSEIAAVTEYIKSLK